MRKAVVVSVSLLILLIIVYNKINASGTTPETQAPNFQQTSGVEIKPTAIKRDKVPVSISIPEFGVNAPIKPVGTDTEGRMATVGDPKTIAWYAYGAVPGEHGNAILAGHRDWDNVLGSFWDLEKLPINSTVQITFSNGSKSSFRVVSNNTYPLNSVPAQVMNLSGDDRTTLITCGGVFDRKKGGYQSRVVVVLKKTMN